METEFFRFSGVFFSDQVGGCTTSVAERTNLFTLTIFRYIFECNRFGISSLIDHQLNCLQRDGSKIVFSTVARRMESSTPPDRRCTCMTLRSWSSSKSFPSHIIFIFCADTRHAGCDPSTRKGWNQSEYLMPTASVLSDTRWNQNQTHNRQERSQTVNIYFWCKYICRNAFAPRPECPWRCFIRLCRDSYVIPYMEYYLLWMVQQHGAPSNHSRWPNRRIVSQFECHRILAISGCGCHSSRWVKPFPYCFNVCYSHKWNLVTIAPSKPPIQV